MRISDGSSDVCSSDLGQRVEKLERLADGHADGRRFRLTTSKGEVIEAGAVIIAAGAGAFGPNRPPLDGIAAYEGRPEGSGEIGRASSRGRVCQYGYVSVVAVSLHKKKSTKNQK